MLRIVSEIPIPITEDEEEEEEEEEEEVVVVEARAALETTGARTINKVNNKTLLINIY